MRGLIRVIREGGKRRGKRGEGRKRGEGKREKRKKIVLFHLEIMYYPGNMYVCTYMYE